MSAATASPEPVAAPTGWLRRLGRVPLLTKIVVLDLVINVGTFVLLQQTPPEHVQSVTLVSLVVVLVLNGALVAWALKPLQIIESTARRVSAGEFGARIGGMSPLADRNLLRIADTLDGLLDRVAAERGRVRSLAAQVVKAGDAERARIARELHDGTAQQLSALEMLLASAHTECAGTPISERLDVMRSIAREALAEVRSLSHTVHPRVLDDLGLAAALDWLARRSGVGPSTVIAIDCAVSGDIPPPIASVLYRVTQEALSNAIRHADARRVHVQVSCLGDAVHLTVTDDGRGFDRDTIEAAPSGTKGSVGAGPRRGMGLFMMEERVSLFDGRLDIESRPGAGTRIHARLPLGDPS
jgi:signal transduction histidine kinase